MTSFFPYTPRQATYDELKASFVAREALLNELILNLKRQASAEALQHWMILGTRGMGKSHIITMIYLLVKQDETLNRKWTPILMKEEEQEIFSLHTLFIRIMTRLSDELYECDKQKSHEIGEVLDSLRNGKSQEEILDTAVSYLKDFVVESKKKLLVLLENADDLFTRCLPNLNHIKKLRNILLNENFLLFLTTSPTSFERISRSSAPLYGFFRIRRLDLLDYDQSVELLKKWARLEEKSDGRGDFISHLKKDNYRLRVLYHLTGGNPRVLLFLYMAISGQGGIKTAADTFRRLLENNLSAYYLSRMRELANQVQPIVIALAESDRNLTQTEIARKTFLPAKSIGTAMVRLENEGIVRPVTDKKGKNTLYTLTDHLFRLWYQWRTSIRDRMVVEAVVEFLAIWYKKKELDTWAGEGGLAGVYCKEAINFRGTKKYHKYLQEFQVYAEKFIDQHLIKKDYHTLFDTMGFWKEYGLDTDKLMKTAIIEIEKHGGLDQAEDYFQEKLKHDEKDFDTYLQLGRILIQKEGFPGAEKVLENAVELAPKDAPAWQKLGLARFLQENYAGAEKAYAKAVKLEPKDAPAWQNLGAARGLQENHAGAEKAFAKAVKLEPKDAAAWRYLAFSRYKNYHFVQAAENSVKSIKLDEKEIASYEFLCESCVMKNLPVETLALLENVLSLDDATDEFRANIHFLRAMIHLHNMDKTPFFKDLESGVMLLEGLEEEKRRELLGKLMDFLVSIIIVDNIKEISAYIDGFKQVKTEQADVFNPLQYVLDYYTEYFAEEKKKGTSVIRTQRVLDNIPGEIRGPVEEMVRKAKKNVLWWERRPKLTSTNS